MSDKAKTLTRVPHVSSICRRRGSGKRSASSRIAEKLFSLSQRVTVVRHTRRATTWERSVGRRSSRRQATMTTSRKRGRRGAAALETRRPLGIPSRLGGRQHSVYGRNARRGRGKAQAEPVRNRSNACRPRVGEIARPVAGVAARCMASADMACIQHVCACITLSQPSVTFPSTRSLLSTSISCTPPCCGRSVQPRRVTHTMSWRRRCALRRGVASRFLPRSATYRHRAALHL